MPSRLVVISGASSGIGLATARRFAAAGDQVVNLDTSAPAAGDKAGEWVAVDVRDWAALDTALGRITAAHGNVEVAIANAGISRRRLFLDLTEADAREVIDTNLMGVIGLWQAAARRMIPARSGVLLATASTNASAGYPYYADYNATKAGVLALCRTLALELAPYIRTACVSPGYVMTAMQQAEYTPAMLAEVNKRIPAGRHAEPAEIAEAFYFLASPAGRYITGQQLVVDGGELAGGTASSHGTAFAAVPARTGVSSAGRKIGPLWAEERFAVAAFEQDCEPVHVAAQLPQVVTGAWIIPLRGFARRGPGKPPGVTDAELACLAVARVLLHLN